MVANQKSQQDVYNELTRANKDKANEAMFAVINTYNGVNRGKFEEWIDELDQACRISGCDFRTKIIKKSIGAVCKVVLTSGDHSDDQLMANLRSCFSDAPMMNQAREDLRNVKQQEKESFMVYANIWGRALVRSSGICPEDENHAHVIKDFISSLQHNIGNKIVNKWADLKNLPHTVQEAFDLAIKTETQIQVADIFKMELTNNFALADINEISADKTSSEEFVINKVSRGKKWSNNNYRKNGYNNNQNFSNKTRYNNKTQDKKSGNKWECKEKDAKITLLQESSHFIPAKFGESIFRQFDIAMQLRKE